MRISEEGCSPFDNDKRPSCPAFGALNSNFIGDPIIEHIKEIRHCSFASFLDELLGESLPIIHIAYKFSVQVYFAHGSVFSPKFRRLLMMSSSGVSCEMVQSNARFFRRPMFVPSGVSMGQSLPRCVGWSSLASKFSCEEDNGETTRCRWLRKSR